MMKRWFYVTAASLVAAAPAMAQGVSSQCPSGAAFSNAQVSQDVCQKTIDLFQYMAPQLGVSLTGGNAMLGQGGTLGGLGHFELELRGIGVNGTVPQVNDNPPSTSGAVASNYKTKTQIIGLPAVDAEIGIFKGIPLGLTNLFGVDLLLNANYIPDYGDSSSNVRVKTLDGNYKIGYGARVGLLQESLLVPGVSVTWVKRDLPKVGLLATTNGSGTQSSLNIDTLNVKTTAWRLVASKNLLILGLAVGAGQDKYDQSAHITATASNGVNSGTAKLSTSQSLTRTTYFADASINLLLFKLIGEIGQVSGGTINTYNTFSTKPDASRIYGSVGLRFGF